MSQPTATRLLYQTDAYCREFAATVLAVHGPAVALDRTAFYPGGGGQPPDLGHLVAGERRWPVRRLWREGAVVWHEVEGDPPAPGDQVTGVLDWARRYALMRTHTALHVLCGVIWRDCRAHVTGGQMEPLRGRLDFEFETLTADRVRAIEEAVNAEIAAARPVRVFFLPRAEADRHPDLIRTKVNLLPPDLAEVRVVEIVGLDLQADGGTHVANTREVGRVRVVDYLSKGRSNKRIVIAVED